MAEKLALIDKDLLIRLLGRNNPTQPPPNPVLEQMGRINDQLQATLDDSNTPERLKSQKINRLLASHENFHKQYDSQFAVPPTAKAGAVRPTDDVVDKSPDTPGDNWHIKTVSAAPPRQHKMTENLLDHIKSSKRMGWDRDGRLVIDGEIIPKTNIVDLIHSMIRRRKKIVMPTGGDKFFRVLNEINTPRELLPNAHHFNAPPSPSESASPRTPKMKKKKKKEDDLFQTPLSTFWKEI